VDARMEPEVRGEVENKGRLGEVSVEDLEQHNVPRDELARDVRRERHALGRTVPFAPTTKKSGSSWPRLFSSKTMSTRAKIIASVQRSPISFARSDDDSADDLEEGDHEEMTLLFKTRGSRKRSS
jgi:hypothetical protein